MTTVKRLMERYKNEIESLIENELIPQLDVVDYEMFKTFVNNYVQFKQHGEATETENIISILKVMMDYDKGLIGYDPVITRMCVVYLNLVRLYEETDLFPHPKVPDIPNCDEVTSTIYPLDYTVMPDDAIDIDETEGEE